MDKALIDKQYNFILELLHQNSTHFESKEFAYRVKKIDKAYYKMLLNNNFIDEFYSLAHEIMTNRFFRRIGEVNIARDSINTAGPDIVFLRKYKIECVSYTTGDRRNTNILKKSGCQVYNKIIDYNEKFRQMSLRFTTVLESKKKKLDNYLEKGII